MKTPLITDPFVDRLADLNLEELSISLVMDVLKRSRQFITDRILGGELPALKERGNAGKKKDKERSANSYHSYRISAASVLWYLVNHTEGNKDVLLSAIEKRFPHHFHLFNSATAAAEVSAPPIPDNVIPITGRKHAAKPKAPIDPAAGHPDLFDTALRA